MNATGEAAAPAAPRPPDQRWALWASLIALVAVLLATLVWLAGRYEAAQVQSRLERDTADAISDIRSATRNTSGPRGRTPMPMSGWRRPSSVSRGWMVRNS